MAKESHTVQALPGTLLLHPAAPALPQGLCCTGVDAAVEAMGSEPMARPAPAHLAIWPPWGGGVGAMLRALGKPPPELQRPPATASPGSGGDGKVMAAQGERLCPYKAFVWAPVCWCCTEPGGAAASAPAGMP